MTVRRAQDAAAPEPPALVVVGAALGTGRWIAEHLLPHAPWRSVTLVDSKTTRTRLGSQAWRLAEHAPIAFAENQETASGDRLVVEGTAEPFALPTGPTVVWFALPTAVLGNALAEMLPRLDPGATVVVSASPLGPVIEAARRLAGDREVVGVHPLFDATMPSLAGQILYVVPAEPRGVAEPRAPGAPQPPEWLSDAIAHAGGILKTGTAEAHDDAMALVQTLTHRVLVDFADAVTDSGLDLERDIWAARTPLFETLFGLAVRVLDSRSSTVPQAELARVQARFPGALFDTIRGTAAAAVAAAQAKRLAFAALWRSGELVGIGGAVGRIVDLSPTSVTLENVLIGPAGPGRGVLATGAGEQNALALGVGGAPKRVTFALSHAEPVTGDALSALLDERLATIRRDVRFLVPESVSGAGVLRVAQGAAGLRASELVDEVVRTGQRAVVIRVRIRADFDPAEVVDALRRRVADAYRWPDGLVRSPRRPVERIVYLGPAGTFSEDAARLGAGFLAAPDAAVDAVDDFGQVLVAIGDPAVATVGVLPITSSASGLVSHAAAALLASGGGIVAGGMFDIAVRFDAYAAPGRTLEELRGGTVFSHPQALAQCGSFIRRLGLQPVECASTADALDRAAQAPGAAVALAGTDKAGERRLEVVEQEVDDLSGSITRFLLVGSTESFGELPRGSQPTVRRLWIGQDPTTAWPLLTGGAGFDELLADADGRWLLVSSRSADPAAAPGATLLGDVPWSPRTPVVRA
ncbi:MAG: prephenate dehydrogenase/arogenate dehydrogenase family protein [Microbacteriaceae bacterium]|nr:prephenate dehydrogenase/arogenate dehydrogenase family protein [Microbacteriaceae bacterium]